MLVDICLALLSVALILWLASMWYINDFSVPRKHLEHVKEALVIFPHADDETNIAGLLWLLKQGRVAVTFVVLTRGENGTPDAHKDLHLKTVRANEVQRVARRLGAGQLIQEDFGDGQLNTQKAELRRYIDKLLQTQQPDLVITYDKAGLYGHEDHITCSEITTELLANYPKTQLWYSVWPKHLLRTAHLPTHMAKDPAFESKRGVPNARIFIGRGVFAKIASVYSHTSQRRSFRSMMPMHVPIWLLYSLQIFEYYERVD